MSAFLVVILVAALAGIAAIKLLRVPLVEGNVTAHKKRITPDVKDREDVGDKPSITKPRIDREESGRPLRASGRLLLALLIAGTGAAILIVFVVKWLGGLLERVLS